MTPDLLRFALMEISAARVINKPFHDLYEGNFEEQFSAQIHRQNLQDASRNWSVNFARSLVDAVVERSKVSGIVTADNKTADVLQGFWDSNEFDFQSKELMTEVCKLSRAFVIALPDDSIESGVSAYIHTTDDVYVGYDPARPRNKMYAVHVFEHFATEEDADLLTHSRYLTAVMYLPNTIQRWVSSSPLVLNSYIDFATVDMVMMEEVRNPIPGTIPVFDFNIRRSRLADAQGPQTMINETIICMMAAIRASSYRQRYVTAERTQLPHDNFSDISPSGSDVEHSQYAAGPDTIFEFLGTNVNVGSFEVSESSNFTDPIQVMLSWLGRVGDMPASYFRDSPDALSGEAYAQSQRPLQAVCEDVQARVNARYMELFEYITNLKGIYGITAEVAFEPQQKISSDFWTTQQTKVELGLPRSVALVEGGYAPEDVDTWAAGRVEIAKQVLPKVVGDDDTNDINIVEE